MKTNSSNIHPYNKLTFLFLAFSLLLFFSSCSEETIPRIATYQVTFNTNEGITITPQTINKGGKAKKPTDPTKADYTFEGWYKEVTFTTLFDFSSTAITSNTTIYAKWKAETYQVTFNTNGGISITPQTINKGDKAKKPTDPTKVDYTFDGWYKEAAFTTLFDFSSTTITSNTTIYAKWKAETYQVTFNTNGGISITPQTINKGDKAKKPTDPTKVDYTFDGWYKEAAFTTLFDFTSTAITNNITIYAKWEKTLSPTEQLIAGIKAANKVDIINIDAPLYDRHGNKIKNKENKLSFDQLFPNTNDVLTQYKNEPGFDIKFDINIRTGTWAIVHGINVNKSGEPYFNFVINNKIYLDDDNYIKMAYVREKTYLKKTDNSIWEIPTSSFSRITWNLEAGTSSANQLNGYAGYKFTNFPNNTTDLNSSVKVKCQVVGGDYIVGSNHTLQLTIQQYLVTPTETIRLDDYTITKTFTTKAGVTRADRYTKYPASVFFQASKTEFGY